MTIYVQSHLQELDCVPWNEQVPNKLRRTASSSCPYLSENYQAKSVEGAGMK